MANPKGNPDNLLKRPPKGAAAKGAAAAAKKKREKRAMQETLRALLEMPLELGKIDDIKCLRDAGSANLTIKQAILIAQVAKAVNGDTQAAIFVRDSSGNKPKEEVKVTTNDSETITRIEEYLKGK